MNKFLKTIGLAIISIVATVGIAYAAINIVPNGGTGVGTITGLVKGNGTSAFSVATAGTDYLKPSGALTAGSALFADGSGQASQNNSKFFWDNTNNRLGIGTNSPVSNVDILGDYPSFQVRNSNASQYAGAGFYLLNTASTMANEGGIGMYAGINDLSASKGFFSIDKTNTTGASQGHLMLFDLDTNSTTFYTAGNSVASYDSSGNYNLGANIQMSSIPTYGYLKIQSRAASGQDDNGENTIVDVTAPSSNPQESTVTLDRIFSGGNRDFTDITDEDYGTDFRTSINVSKQGTGLLRPFAVRFWNQDLGRVANFGVMGLQVDPAGVTAVGKYSGSNYDTTTALQVLANSGATNGFVVDNPAGTHKFAVTPSGATTGLSFNGVALTTGGSATAFLNGAGSYAAPFSLTTTGTSGAATFSAGTLNIPQYSGGSGITVGTTTIASGTSGRVEFNNSGVVGEYQISGTGNVAMTTSPSFTTPAIGAATGTSLVASGVVTSDHFTSTSTTNQSFIAGGLTVGDTSRAPYPFTVVGSNATTGVGDFGLLGDVQTDTTANDTIGFQHGQANASGTVQTTAGWDFIGNSHTVGAQSTSIAWATRNAGSFGERMRLNFNGNFSIGSTTTTSLFNVGSSAQFQVTSAGHVLVEGVTSSGATGTGSFVFGTSPTIATPTITTSATAPLVIGGTGTTSTLTLQSTSGVGATGADILFKTGNNGATTAMDILNSGKQINVFGGSKGIIGDPSNFNWFFGDSGNTTATGQFNTGLGRNSLLVVAGGGSNMGIGLGSFGATTSGSQNAGVGVNTGANNVTGGDNVAIGNNAGVGVSGNSYNKNIFLGSGSAHNVTTGSSDICIGFSSCFNITTDGNSLFVNNILESSVANDKAYSLLYGTFSGSAASLAGQQLTVNGALGVNSVQTVVSCSTSGTVTFSQPFIGATYKQVVAYESACLGTASYTFPTAFTNTPDSIGVNAVKFTSISASATTVTGTTTTGFSQLYGY